MRLLLWGFVWSLVLVLEVCGRCGCGVMWGVAADRRAVAFGMHVRSFGLW